VDSVSNRLVECVATRHPNIKWYGLTPFLTYTSHLPQSGNTAWHRACLHWVRGEEKVTPTCYPVLLRLLVRVPVLLLPVGEDHIRSVPQDQFRSVARLQQLNPQLLRIGLFLSLICHRVIV
jgi:hypothetical protein